ncbi:unnamed protein product [Orchesella dallaii]|uniref:UNC93-like protein MFSD11 n=1 Tax=Orchesella dallaii TaxID=48710 RepID=A0ABP1PYR1_9HEXA
MAKKKDSDGNLRNVVILSIGFMLLMGAFFTMAGIEQTILQSIYEEDPSYDADGYLSLSIINGVYSVTNFIAPFFVSCLGVRTSMILGTSFYAFFIAGFYYPKALVVYGTSAACGLAASIVWVANGTYFTRCSTKETIGKNMGIYWVVQSSGMVLGNGFIYWQFQGGNHIEQGTRFFVISVLTCISACATITLFFLGPTRDQKMKEESNLGKWKNSNEEKVQTEEKQETNICHSFTEPFRLLTNKHMLLLIPPAIYNGFEIAFFAGIYPTAVGFTEGFGDDARKLVGFAGILIGIGTLLGGLIFGVFGDKIVNSRRSLVVIIACISHFISLALIYINHPDSASREPTTETSWLTSPTVEVAMISAFLLGLGDGCLQPQIFAAVGVIWPEKPGAALALCRFFQGGSVAVGFFASTMIGLYSLSGGLLVVALVGTVCFCFNEKLIDTKEAENKNINLVLQVDVIVDKNLSVTEISNNNKEKEG